MLIFRKASDITHYLLQLREKGSVSGFVPTMGALHTGHISLIDKAQASCDLVICSIFVNPTQFNDPEDFKKYPVTIEQDIYMLEKAGCDVLFLPSVTEMYPEATGQHTQVHYDIGYLESVLEGAYRPGHFQGVCTIVHKLLDIIQPDKLFMGQKDYQQCMVIKKLLVLINSPARLIVSETLREPNGLAMSSRNQRLSEEERKLAAGIFETLQYIGTHVQPGPLGPLLLHAEQMLKEKKLDPDYMVVANADTLEVLDVWDGVTGIVALAAAYMGKVRLIDNLTLPRNFA